ncbi:hypothetical protein Tco_0575915 [Tanacetum coccineum]
MNSQRELNPYAPPFYPSRFNHHHASITNRTNKCFVHFPVATGPRHCAVPNRKPKDKPHFNKGVVPPTKRRVYVMFDNKGDAYHWRGVYQLYSFWCMDTYWLEVMLVNALRRFRESLRRVTDGAEAFLILTLFILTLDKVSTDHAKLVPLGKVCTAKETLEKNTAKGTKCKLEPLISLTDDHSLLSKMAALESCPKHNMIAYLEKTEGNVEFHEVIDFLRRSYVYHALTVSPIVSTTFVEQFWTSAKSKTINNVRHITAKVAGKLVSISEASIRTDLIFDDADGIDLLTKSSYLDAIHVWDRRDVNCTSEAKKKFVMISQIKKKKLLLKAQITKLKKQAKPLKSANRHQTFKLSEDCPHCKNDSQEELPKKHRCTKSPCTKQGRKIGKGESSVQRDPMFDVMPEDISGSHGIENAQSEGRTRETVSTDFKKVSTDKPIVSTDGSKVSTEEHNEGTEVQREGTEEIFEDSEEKVESTAGQTESTEDQTKEEVPTQASQTSSQTPTFIIFGDDETIATLLLNMSQAKAASKEKEKGVELKDVEEIDRPRPTSTRSLLTLKPLPKINPKDKGKKKIEEEDESDNEDDDIPQAVKKFKQLESDEELARKVQEEWEAEEERNRIAEEKATNEALIKNFDDIQARIGLHTKI